MFKNKYLIVNLTKQEYLSIGVKTAFESEEILKTNSTLTKTVEKLMYRGGDWYGDKVGFVANTAYHQVSDSFLSYLLHQKQLVPNSKKLKNGGNELELYALICKTFKPKHVLPRFFHQKNARFIINESKRQYIDLYSIRKIGSDFLDGDYYISPFAILNASFINWVCEFDCSVEESIVLNKYGGLWLGDLMSISDKIPKNDYEEMMFETPRQLTL